MLGRDSHVAHARPWGPRNEEEGEGPLSPGAVLGPCRERRGAGRPGPEPVNEQRHNFRARLRPASGLQTATLIVSKGQQVFKLNSWNWRKSRCQSLFILPSYLPPSVVFWGLD